MVRLAVPKSNKDWTSVLGTGLGFKVKGRCQKAMFFELRLHAECCLPQMVPRSCESGASDGGWGPYDIINLQLITEVPRN